MIYLKTRLLNPFLPPNLFQYIVELLILNFLTEYVQTCLFKLSMSCNKNSFVISYFESRQSFLFSLVRENMKVLGDCIDQSTIFGLEELTI